MFNWIRKLFSFFSATPASAPTPSAPDIPLNWTTAEELGYRAAIAYMQSQSGNSATAGVVLGMLTGTGGRSHYLDFVRRGWLKP